MKTPSADAAFHRAAVSAVLAAASLAALWGAGRLHAPLLNMRRAGQLDQADPAENMPPLVAFTTVAIGGFRGLVVDALWVRLQSLQEQGRYFELVQLADWITKLQPRFATVWGFQAWNLSYNVSAMFDDPADRWRWVRHGLTLLRDRGLHYNPGSWQIHFELSWLFFHKIGQDLDAAHAYYKTEWAREMNDLFGGPSPDWVALAAAPASRPDFLRDPARKAFVQRLESEGLDPWDRRWLRRGGAEALPEWARSSPAAEAWRAFLRADRLRGEYRLEPSVMLEVERRFGPFDWRLAPAHAVYWARRGLPFAREDFQRRSLERRALQAAAEGVFQGRVAGVADGGRLLLARNLDALPKVLQAYEEAARRDATKDGFAPSLRSLLVDAVMFRYTSDDPAAAGLHFERLRALNEPDLRAVDLETFVSGLYAGYVARGGPPDASAVVDRALYESEFWKRMGDARQAAGYARLAELCWRRPAGGTDPGGAPPVLPPLEALRESAATRAVADAAKYRAGPELQ